MHVINLEVTDNTEEAAKAGQIALDFCSRANDLQEALDLELANVVEEFQAKYNRSFMHMTVYLQKVFRVCIG